MMKHIFCLLCATLLICADSFAKAPQRPTFYNYQRGVEAYVNEKDHQKALDYLNKELEEHPKDGYSHAWIAYIRLDMEEYGRALTCVNSAIKLLPKADKEYMVFAYTTRGSIYEHLEDTASAISDYTQAIKIDPSVYKSYEHRAELYYHQHKYAQSDADYQKMTQMDDNGAVVSGYMGLGRNFQAQKRDEEAIKIFSKLITLYDDYSSAYSFRAQSLLELKRYEEAIADIVKALDIDGDNKAYWTMLTIKEPEAVDMMLKKLQLQSVFSPNYPGWPYYMGLVCEVNKRYKEAIEAYKKTNKMVNDSQLDYRIAECYYSLGDFDSALGHINYAIEADSIDQTRYYLRANIYAELGQIEKSIEDMSSYIELDPRGSYGYYRRGWWKQLLHQCDEAIEDFIISQSIDPSYTHTYDGMIRCYISIGDTVKVRKECEMLLKIDTIAVASSCAQFAYHFLGQDEKAIEWIEKILKNDSSATYDAACIYSMVSDTAKALVYLQKTLDNNWVRFHHLEIDEDLNNIRHLESYKRMLEKRKQEVLQNISGEKVMSSATLRIVEVPFTAVNGVTKVDCSINGLPLNFVFDTGASDVSLSQVEANFMFKNGYLNSKDVIGKQRYQTADGNISEGTVVNLRQINFGGLELKDIRASVVRSQSAPLLLGQSILQRLGKIEIDNTKRVLKITTR